MKRPNKIDIDILETRLLQGYSKSDIARELGITRPTLDNWIKKCDPKVIDRALEMRGGTWRGVKRNPNSPELSTADFMASNSLFDNQINPLKELAMANAEIWNIYNSSKKEIDKTRALTELRHQVKAMADLVRQIYDMNTVKQFMQIVVEEVDRVDSDTATRIRDRLRNLISDRTASAGTN